MVELFNEDVVKTEVSLLSHYYSCQQKKYFLTKKFEQSQFPEERYYWIKQINKNELELDSLKALLSSNHSQEIQDNPPQYRL